VYIVYIMYVCVYVCMHICAGFLYADNLRRSSCDRQHSVVPVLMPRVFVRAFEFTLLPCMLCYVRSPCLSKALEVFSFHPLGARQM
jgi:hypothetical protein